MSKRIPNATRAPKVHRSPRAVRFGTPWFGVALVVGLGEFIRAKVLDAGTERIALAVLAAGGAQILATVAGQYAAPRREIIRSHVFWAIQAFAVLFAGSVLVGFPYAWRWVVFVGGSLLALSLNIRNLDMLQGTGEDAHGNPDSILDNIGLDNTDMKMIESGPEHTLVKMVGKRGKSAAEIVKRLPALEAARGLRPGSLTGVKSETNAAEVIVRHQKGNPLLGDIDRPLWDGTRRSIAEGVALGVYADGTQASVWLAGAKGVAPSLLQVMGMTRSGKSHLFRMFVWGVAECFDVVLWVSDVRKGVQTLRPVLPAIDRFEYSQEGTRRILADIERMITYRANQLGMQLVDEWFSGVTNDRGEVMPLLIFWVEEAAISLAGNTRWTRLCESALSAGIILVDSMQRADHSNKETGARSQVGSSICLGVNSDTDSGFVLSDDVQEVSQLHNWGTRYQGRFMADLPYVDQEHRLMVARTYWTDGLKGRLTESVRTLGPDMARLDSGTRSVCSDYVRPDEWTDADWDKALGRTVDGPQDRTDGPQDEITEAEAMRMLDDMDPDGATDNAYTPDEIALIELDDDGPEPGPPPPGAMILPVPPSGPELRPDEAHRVFLAAVRACAARSSDHLGDGTPVVHITDVEDECDVHPAFSRTRQWVSGRMAKLVEDGVCRRASRKRDGRYAVLVDPVTSKATMPESHQIDGAAIGAFWADISSVPVSPPRDSSEN